ncbi:MAG: DoxX family protein [Micropepsaceae bacterium]
MTDTTASPSQLATILTWILKLALAAAFGAAAIAKLTSRPDMVEHFNVIGLGPNFIYITGGIELASASLLLLPPTAFLGALGLVGISLGAFIAQVGALHGDLIHVYVLGALALIAAWVTTPAYLR